jgi:GTP-binding protein
LSLVAVACVTAASFFYAPILMFIDQANILIASGNGGHGCISFRREKFIPKGGPDGGDGGHGGDVIFEVDTQLNTLLIFAGKHHWRAGNGRPGEGSNRSGKSADDLVVTVPPGTAVFDHDTGLQLTELTSRGQRVVILRGGRGGLGNRNFATSRNQAPRHATDGRPGQQRWIRLELRLIADVGLVGLPNAGKSTLLSRTTRARPKIADYPFTTLVPQLGIVELSGYRQYILADIPGLIEGAHTGAGLGDAFLRHIERTRVLVHLVDAAPLEGAPDPAKAYRIIRNELEAHNPILAAKEEIIVVNKMDLTDAPAGLEALRAACGGPVLEISAATGQGLAALHEIVWKKISALRDGSNT